ncbi:unannotated protein [freshwater metagenome]|uniref:Unannotated protein n=1 Tax=freshwater metagenome TaxID=449393 RepID=A0A6J6IKC5_9ZZZZ|nr:DUF4245 family protein [Actinomycetota bacterium]
MSDAAAQRRARQTLINLLLSLVATVGVMVLLVLAVPRDDSNRVQPVDYKAVATEAAKQAPGVLLVPTLPVDWYANAARYRSSAQDGVANWYLGFVGPNNEFLAMTQGIDVNSTWTQLMLESSKQTGEVIIQDQTWRVFENVRKSSLPKSKDYMMVLDYGKNSVFVYGVATKQQLEDFALSIALLISDN